MKDFFFIMNLANVRLVVLLSLILTVLSEKVIKIDNGMIVGEELDDFFAYRGIPYAESPVDELRFAPPKTYAQSWEGVKKFINYTDVCAQYHHSSYSFTGVEDCLNLNVFVPKTKAKSDEGFPVIVYIHGGAFMFGGAKFKLPENIMKGQSMILVTVNYRLGILGFLSTEDNIIPGNFGLKDQVEALRWVQRNIASFNGDKDKVTIVGFSAGGASVQLHYMSPLTDGLFNNGISHSGVALNPWVMVENSKEKAHQIASFLNCPEDHQSLLICLREKPAEDLVVLAKKFQPFLYNPFSPFGVVVEPESDTAFLTESPKSILEKGNFKRLPWFLSQTQDEGLYPAAEFYNEKTLKTINDEWDTVAPFILDFDGLTSNSNKKLQMSRKIRHHYLGNAQINKNSFMDFHEILTDRLFKHGAYKAIQLQSHFSPAYFYHFRYKSLYGLGEYISKSRDFIGISHGEDIFLIYWHRLRDFPYSEEEAEIGQNLIDLYYNFAKYSLAVYNKVKIDPSKPNDVKCLEITKSVKMVQLDEHFGQGLFWDEIEHILQTKEKTYYDEL